MTPNMASADRLVRALVVAPVAIIAAYIAGVASIGGIVLLAVAAIMLATAAAGFCPLYALFGLRTNATR